MAKRVYRNVETYNPLDVRRFGESVARAVLDAHDEPLPPEPFRGTGIYALYYCGSFEPYATLAEVNRVGSVAPIYIGKAEPRGSRKGGGEYLEASTDPAIFNRLRGHAKSVDAAANIELESFRCRYLVVAPIWVTLAEKILINRFDPLWNSHISGFGLNAPGKERRTQARSMWDVLHPGRYFAETLSENELSAEEIATIAREALERLAALHSGSQEPA